jgi:hypothetical protein
VVSGDRCRNGERSGDGRADRDWVHKRESAVITNIDFSRTKQEIV